MNQFSNINGIKMWAGTNDVKFLDELPYVQKDEQFYYFGTSGKGYTLLMTSSKDLGEVEA